MLLLVEQRLKALMDFFLQNMNAGYLTQLFGNETFGDGSYNYLDNAKAIFLKANDNPRKVVCNLFYNRDRQGLPTIHIALNQDTIGEGNGLGFDPSEQYNEVTGLFDETLTRTYSSRFNIVCTSDNTMEVLIMYNVVKALFQGNPVLVDMLGLKNMKLGGQDLILSDYLMPPTIYARGFFIDCIYEVAAPPFTLDGQGVEGIREAFVSCVCGKNINIID